MTALRVYKVGGPALEDPSLARPLAEEVRRGSGPAVVVHGGGRHVDRMLRDLSIESRFVEGRRETSPAAMEVDSDAELHAAAALGQGVLLASARPVCPRLCM